MFLANVVFSAQSVPFTFSMDASHNSLTLVAWVGGGLLLLTAILLNAWNFNRLRRDRAAIRATGRVIRPEEQQKMTKRLIMGIIPANLIFFAGLIVLFAALNLTAETAMAAEDDQVRLYSWLELTQEGKEFGDDYTDLLKFEAVEDAEGNSWVLKETSEGAGEYELSPTP